MVWGKSGGVLKEFSLSYENVTSLMLNKFQHLFINFYYFFERML